MGTDWEVGLAPKQIARSRSRTGRHRWVRRSVPMHEDSAFLKPTTVLQEQWLETDSMWLAEPRDDQYHWQDVPVEDER